MKLGRLAAAGLLLSCSSGGPNSDGIVVGSQTPVDLPEVTGCENTFPANAPVEFKPDFGVDRPTREEAVPKRLSKTGLYTDIRTKEVHAAMRPFQPTYELWSDGADKKRWVYIPECDTIDTSNMDDWVLPVGTRLFKEFSIDGRRIETRLIERIGEGPRDFAYVSYLWNADESDARAVDPEGLPGAHGTAHDIPSKSGCLKCHGTFGLGGGRPSRALGFSALQLSHEGPGLTLSDLVDDNKLSHPPTQTFVFPGDASTQKALGMLHANCGNCHNDTKDRVPHVDLSLWVETGATEVEETGAWQTAVGQPTALFKDQHITGRIVPGKPEESALVYRMQQRGNTAQMPPLATHTVDAEGVAALQEWIGGLP